jgi:hypothetical protein
MIEILKKKLNATNTMLYASLAKLKALANPKYIMLIVSQIDAKLITISM